MTSSPSPTTSTRAATISSRKERRSSSFPSLAALNPFRSKSAPEEHTPTEPYLVAPGIWSTDATAKVFGYIGTDDKGRLKLPRSHSANSDKRIKSPTPSTRSLLRGRILFNRYKEVHQDDGSDDFSNRTHCQRREDWEFARQEGRDESRFERQSSETRSRKGKMRTVSQDDELTERGANPRTGIISPFVMSTDGSADGGDNDYISRGRGCSKSPLSSTSRRTSSGRWQQNRGSWSFVVNPVPSPTKLQSSDRPFRHVSVTKVQDKLLAQMPGADNAEPDNMTNEQIRRYQLSVERAYRNAGGSHAMLDPETLPTPREASPAFGTERPSTPPNKLHKIRRKEVGSASIPERKSTDPVIVNGKQRSASALPPPQICMPSMEKQQVRIVSPSMLALGVPPVTPLDVQSSFLGSPQQCSRTVSAGQFPLTQPLSPQTNQRAHQRPLQSQDQEKCPSEASVPEASSPTLNQSPPRLQFMRPSHLANLESTSYRRPAHLLPPSLRSGPQKRQLVEDAATITTTITSPKKERRPGMQRLEGRNTVPRASHHNRQDRQDRQDRPRHVRSQVPLIKIFEPSSPTKSTGDSGNVKSSEFQRTHLYPSFANHGGGGGPAPRANQLQNGGPQVNQPRSQKSQLQTNSNQSYPQSNLPKVTSFQHSDRMKQAEDISRMVTDTNHGALPYPCQSISDSMERNVQQVSHHHGDSQTSQSHVQKSSPMMNGCGTMRPPASFSGMSLPGVHQSQHSRRYSSTSGVDTGTQLARRTMEEGSQHQSHQQDAMQPRKRAAQRLSQTQTPNASDASCIVSDQDPQGRDNDRFGITQAYDLQVQDVLAPENGRNMHTDVKEKGSSILTDFVLNSDGGVCFAGNWAKENNSDSGDDAPSVTTLSTNAEELLSRRRSLLRRGQDLAQHLAAIEGLLRPGLYLDYAQRSLLHMVIHVASTLHHRSPAIKTFRGPGNEKVESKGKLEAAKEIALAMAYVMILLNVAILLRKVMMAVLRIVYWIWHPFMAIGIVLRWCLIT